jgi:hypothetical protein
VHGSNVCFRRLFTWHGIGILYKGAELNRKYPLKSSPTKGKEEQIPSVIRVNTGLTRIPTPYRVYLVDTGKEGRARDSRPPQPHQPVDLFLTGGGDESQ